MFFKQSIIYHNVLSIARYQVISGYARNIGINYIMFKVHITLLYLFIFIEIIVQHASTKIVRSLMTQTGLSYFKDIIKGGSLGFFGEPKRAIIGCRNAEIHHRFGGMWIVYLIRTLADSGNNQFLFADLRKQVKKIAEIRNFIPPSDPPLIAMCAKVK